MPVRVGCLWISKLQNIFQLPSGRCWCVNAKTGAKLIGPGSEAIDPFLDNLNC